MRSVIYIMFYLFSRCISIFESCAKFIEVQNLGDVQAGLMPISVYQRQEALARLAQGETLTEIARSMAVSHMTISRLGA